MSNVYREKRVVAGARSRQYRPGSTSWRHDLGRLCIRLGWRRLKRVDLGGALRAFALETVCRAMTDWCHSPPAAAHLVLARAHISALVNSFERDEPLRHIFLSAASVRRIREEASEMER